MTLACYLFSQQFYSTLAKIMAILTKLKKKLGKKSDEPEPVIEKIKEKLAPKDKKCIKKGYFSRI